MEKYPLPKDSLKRIVKIMEYVEEHSEQLNEQDLINEFGANGNWLFKEYCRGGNEPYVNDPGGRFQLTQIGIRKLHDLRRILAEERSAMAMKWATIVMATFIGLQFLKMVGIF
jgi:hypothetical protein